MFHSSHRRSFLKTSLIGSTALALSNHAYAQQADSIVKKTFTYKKVGKLEIKADVYRADDKKLRPVVVWIHGGALINGHRGAVSGRVKKSMLDAGCCLVSIDYRLAPETILPEIIQDLEDAFTWIHEQGSRLFQADVNRVVVMGGSAGGYLTLTAGYRAKPTPAALVSFWGYGDLVGDWYSKPSPHKRHHQTKLTRQEAFANVSGRAISDARDRKGNGGAFYQYCRQHGIWPQAVSGWDPRKEKDKFNPYMPVMNVTKDYPPTVLIHGTKDTDVPYEQSVMMAKQFKKHGVEHKLISIENGEHGLGGGDRQEIEAAYKTAFDFTKKILARNANE